eukprot:TRINITY_DN11951_c0_g1_i1.p1 TRINITY_DN11951_c0_g1~~TRINITY_DN11951_c0_g1_i1.p1  ORF type:complete len:801 (+),score=124.15 TRINITY_DN11951_c0_g1_i1:52-2403(+)
MNDVLVHPDLSSNSKALLFSFVRTYNGGALPPLTPEQEAAAFQASLRRGKGDQLKPPNFSFTNIPLEELEPFQHPASLVLDDVQGAPEPEVGSEPEGFDIQAFSLRRQSSPNVICSPFGFSKTDPPIRPFSSYRHEEILAAPEFILEKSTLPSGAIENIKCVILHGVNLDKKQVKALPTLLASYINVEVLVLNKLGPYTKHMKGRLKCPRIRTLDLANNSLDSFGRLLDLISGLTRLESLNIEGNPSLHASLPLDYTIRLVGSCPYMEVLNGKSLDVETRFQGISMYGPKQMRHDLPRIRWQLVLDSIPEVKQQMSHNLALAAVGEFAPLDLSYVVKLALPSCKLPYFNVCGFSSLEELDLSSNFIETLRNQGLEHADRLRVFDLRDNLIGRREELKVFGLVPLLRVVMLQGNKLKNYRSRLIYETRFLKGSNRVGGLLTVDREEVSIMERCGALLMWGTSAERRRVDDVRWAAILRLCYGAHQLATVPGLLQGVRRLLLLRQEVPSLDLAQFTNLEVADLAGIALFKVTGLDTLTRLRVLNLANNPSLKSTPVFQQISGLSSLESFSFFVVGGTHKRSPQSKTYRSKVITRLIFANRRLQVVDEQPIMLEERIAAYKNSGAPAPLMEQYRFNLVLTLNCTIGNPGRDYHFDAVLPGQQYQPRDITILRRMAGWGIVSEAANFQPFQALVELDLSGNRIQNLLELGLQGLALLRVICLHNNEIDTPLAAVAELMLGWPSLEVITLRSNPCMRTDDDRLKLIGLIPSFRMPVSFTLLFDHANMI